MFRTPLLTQEGWTRHQADAAKPPLMERTGWSRGTKHFGMPDHPVCGAKVGFAAFFLMPQPPLLYQEGSWQPSTIPGHLCETLSLFLACGRGSFCRREKLFGRFRV